MARSVGGLSKRVKDTAIPSPENGKDKDNVEESVKEPSKRPSALVLKMKIVPVLGLAFLCLAPYLYFLVTSELTDGVKAPILINLAMSIGGFFLTIQLVPIASAYLIKKNMFGYDLNKKGLKEGTVKVPESLGLVVGIAFLSVAGSFQPFYFNPDHSWLPEHNAALLCICFMLFLGFIDDVLDLPWRVKLLLPTVACFPLLMAYSGYTTILVPKPLQQLLAARLLDLGFLYYIYMGMVAVFCTNSINIHAGLNGLEVGQTVVIASSVLILNVTKLTGKSPDLELQKDGLGTEAHLFSIFLMQPLVAASFGLLMFNWYPSSVFVGDTFTYFAGMTLAVVGILGHFSETLLLFFLPQILNFLYSVPQLFNFIPCPRHRLPRFDPETKLLTGTNDLTVVNFFLRNFGRCTEQALCVRLLIFQAMSCGLCFFIRWALDGWYK